MKKFIILLLVLAFTLPVSAIEIDLALSGKGVINDSTVTAGEPFTVDLLFTNDGNFKAFSFGISFKSDNITSVIHPQDTAGGLNKNGDVKGHDGWEDRSLWDLGGVYVVEHNWDNKLPELLGFGGVSTVTTYDPHEKTKKLSVDLQVDEVGVLVIDSSFFSPSGKWLFVPPQTPPVWSGPFKIHFSKAKK